MNKIWLLLAIVTMVSCKPEKEVDYTIISGKIENVTSKKITLYNQFDTSLKSDVTLAEDGTFSDTIRMASQFYFLREGRNTTSLYAPKGSNIEVNYDAEKLDSTITFQGSTVAVNSFLIEKAKLSKELMGDMTALFLKDEAGFKKQLLAVKSASEKLLSDSEGLSADFKVNEKSNINYSYLSMLTNYEPAHGYYIKDRSFKASENFLDELKEVDTNNENDFIFSNAYRDLVSSKLRKTAKEIVKKDSLAADLTYLNTVATVKSEMIKNKLLFDEAKNNITYTDDIEAYYAIFSKNSTDKENNKKITESYNKLKSLAKGTASPKFTDYEDNAGGTKSLDDLKGKYVYIDVWATWCGPCIGEIPSLKKVEEQFHGKNIHFLSISIDADKDHDKWKKMIVDKELGGIQVIADNDWNSKFVQDYMINGIPRFILLDPQGNIVNANAPRPSDPKLVETLNGLGL